MDRTQANNFIAILRTALGNGQVPLEHPDWDKLAEWAGLQSLTALFYTGACQFQEFAQWDGTKRQKLQREAIAGVVAQSTRTELFLDVYRSLLEKGQKPLVLKGVVVRQLYGELSDYRPSCDEDLYVRPEEAIPCRRELENLGFRITVPEEERKLSDPFQEVSLDHSSGMLHVELHPNFFERTREDLRLSNHYYQNAHDTAVPIHTGGTTLWTLDETHHFLYLFLHLAKHFKGAGVGLKQAPGNKLRELTGFEKVSEIAGSVFYPTWLEDGMELCTDTLNHLLTDLPVYRLDNRADRESVEILAKELDRIT